jgi:hypothetical protein
MSGEHKPETSLEATGEEEQTHQQFGNHVLDIGEIKKNKEGWLLRFRSRVFGKKQPEDKLKKIKKAHAELALSSTIDKNLLLEEYKLHIDLYKHYFTLVATFNAFYYGITGGILTYFFQNAKNSDLLVYSLIFPIIMSFFFALVFGKSWLSFRAVEEEIDFIAEIFGFTRPEVSTLTRALGSSFLMFLFNMGSLGIFIYLIRTGAIVIK